MISGETKNIIKPRHENKRILAECLLISSLPGKA